MPCDPKIPYGYRRVTGQSQKGVWDGTRFRRVKKDWPVVPDTTMMIRKCVVTQVALPLDQPCQIPRCPFFIVDHSEEVCPGCGHCIKCDD